MSLDIGLRVYVDTGGDEKHEVDLFSANYTHNVVPMWEKAGCYDALYNSHGKQAIEVREELLNGLKTMIANPVEYEKLNPENKWGDYNTAVSFLREVCEAFCRHPKAEIWVSK